MSARESPARRKAAHYDLRLVKSRGRNPDAPDHGLYALLDIRGNYPVNPSLLGRYACSWSLDQAEDYLAVVPNEDALEKFVKLHGLPIKVGG